MSDVIDFASRKAEADGVADTSGLEMPTLDNLRLSCDNCGCMSFEINGNGTPICAGCNVSIISANGVNVIVNVPGVGPGDVVVTEEPRLYRSLSNMSTDKFIERLRENEAGLVFVLAAYASGSISYRMSVPVTTNDGDRINWVYERVTRMLECEGVDLEIPE